ncbi:hypothetical protein ACLOJK_011265 [Asimina triloba]
MTVIHPFAEHLLYFALFTIPMIAMVTTRTNCIVAMAGYETYIDFMNNLGHCNFELVPKWLFQVFPPLKYLMYTPSTNYALFLPMYDYLYGTADKSSDSLYEASHKGKKETPDVVHLTHPTTLHSIYHLRLGFAGYASRPYASNLIYGKKYYLWSRQKATINRFIEKAILEADEGGTRVVSLGLLNQGEELNKNGELYLQKHPNLKVKIVDGSSLAAAAVLNNIPQDTSRVLLRGKLTKTGYAVALALCQKGIQLISPYSKTENTSPKLNNTRALEQIALGVEREKLVMSVKRDEFEQLKLGLPKLGSHLVLSGSYTCETWLVGDGVTEEEQRKAPKATRFIPFSQFPPKRVRKDCIYYSTPAFAVPKALEDMHACENWLPRRVMSAWRVAGMVHGLEGWDVNECGDKIFDAEKVWTATLHHGFIPFAGA